MNPRNKTVRLLCAALLLAATSVGAAWAAPSLVITGQGGTYDVQGQGFDGVGAMDLTLGYDASTLANPRVNQGGMISGAMMAPNTTAPGVVRVGIITSNVQGITGSGSILSLNFNTMGEKAGHITSFSATLYSVKGVKITAQTGILVSDAGTSPISGQPSSDIRLTTPGQQSLPTAQQPYGVTGTSAATSPAILGGVPLAETGRSQEPSRRTEETTIGMTDPNRSVDSPSEIVPETASSPEHQNEQSRPERTAVTPSKEKPQTVPKNVVCQSVQSLFREYTGPKTLQALSALFYQSTCPGVRQEPAIALSDGTTKVRVFIDRIAPDSSSPNFALEGVKLVSLTTAGTTYILEVLPELRTTLATISVVDEGSATTIPLTLAPPLDVQTIPTGKLDESSFALFLKGQGAQGDINGDGVKNYLDEYIFTANYLVKGGKK
jgi:hypothetical protein